MPSSTVDAGKGKRTRINVKQSKYGCFTCKARRIKCDETKPTCKRCLTAKRPCNYPHGAPIGSLPESPESTSPSSSSLASSLTPCLQSSLILNPSTPPNRFVNLACTLLVQGPRRAKNDLEMVFWSHLVPQLTESFPSVRAAAEVFGASYDAHILRGSDQSEPIKCYSQALRLLQLELSSLQHLTVPSIVACLFLAFAEVLQHRLDKGLLHLQGAFALMKSCGGRNSNAVADIQGLPLLLEKLDLHSATYAVGLAPNLPQSPCPEPSILLSNSPDQELFPILHSCYHFTSTACLYKYASHRLVPPEMLIKQGRLLASLKHWLSCHEAPLVVADDEQLVVLRAQCLTALIYVGNILDPRETAFDSYGPEFQEIVLSVEALPRYSPDNNVSQIVRSNNLPFFAPEMGTIHPLYFTALKYRHPLWRRKAIGLLQNSGMEGPWSGKVQAAVVLAVVRAEEEHLASKVSGPGEYHACETGDIPETSRINICWTVEHVSQDTGTRSNTDCGQRTERMNYKVKLVRCYDLDEMIRKTVTVPDELPWKDRTHWDGWEEELQVL